MRRTDIIDAITEERSINEDILYFKTVSGKKNNEIYTVKVESKEKLDENLEGCKAWWINDKNDKKTKGAAEVIYVDHDNEKIHLRYLSGETPKENTIINVYPKEFLKLLQELWENKNYSEQAIKNFELPVIDVSIGLKPPKEFTWLREAQKNAYDLFQKNKGILWGPPGTGKTTILGTMIASYIVENPQKKILLMALTNLAVDQILLKVDEQLKKLDSTLVKKCVRIGSNFESKEFLDKDYLIATKDIELLKQLIELEKDIPEKDDIILHSQWKEKCEELRKKFKLTLNEIKKEKNLIAMTTARALYEFENLKEETFDLIVFDEASQINLPQVMMLSQLGKQVIYAGDYKQLNPIATTKNKQALTWMGNSIFKYKENFCSGSMIKLNEQSRMKDEICDIVSHLFYDGNLIVAKNFEDKDRWLEERKLDKNDCFNGEVVIVEPIKNNCKVYQTRYQSADAIADSCKKLIGNGYEGNGILVLTPFKAQKKVIKNKLESKDIKNIDVHTVHKSQGSEYHTVIFDPVAGDSSFLNNEEAKRLINVALSRAKARLILYFSQEDLDNEIFKNIYNIFKQPKNDYITDLSEYIKAVNFPHNLLNKHIEYKKSNGKMIKGKVEDIEDDGKHIRLLCSFKGEQIRYGVKQLFEID